MRSSPAREINSNELVNSKSEDWPSSLRLAVIRQLNRPLPSNGEAVVLHLRLSREGSVLSASIIAPGTDRSFNESVIRAAFAVSKYPLPSDPKSFDPSINLCFSAVGTSCIRALATIRMRTIGEVQAAFDRSQKVFKDEFESGTGPNHPRPEGRIIVSIEVQPDGHISSVSLVSSSYHEPLLESRVLSRVSEMQFDNRAVPIFRLPNYPIYYIPTSAAGDRIRNPTEAERVLAERSIRDIATADGTMSAADRKLLYQKLKEQGGVSAYYLNSETGREIFDGVFSSLAQRQTQDILLKNVTSVDIKQADQGVDGASVVLGRLIQTKLANLMTSMDDKTLLSFYLILAQVMENVSPQECNAMRKDYSLAMGTWIATVERLSPAIHHQFAQLIIEGFKTSIQPRQVPVTQAQKDLLRVAVQRQLLTLNDRDQLRVQQGMNEPESPDNCWAHGQTAQAMLSAEPELGLHLTREFLATQSH